LLLDANRTVSVERLVDDLGERISHLLGGLLVLTGVVFYALWIVLQKRALRTLPPFTVTAWATWFGALFALPFGTGLPHTVGTAPPSALLTLFSLGVITTTVPFLLWTWTMSQLDASKAAPLLLLIAPATLLVGFVWLGEVPGVRAVIGGAVTLAGVASNTTLGSSLLRRTGARRSARTPTRGLLRGRAATLPS
jgi:drug/metabolite transporter (DMT)-like permease